MIIRESQHLYVGFLVYFGAATREKKHEVLIYIIKILSLHDKNCGTFMKIILFIFPLFDG